MLHLQSMDLEFVLYIWHRIVASWSLNEVFLCVGILFQDITTLLLDPVAFKDTIDLFVERYKDKDISVVAGNLSSGLLSWSSVHFFWIWMSFYCD